MKKFFRNINNESIIMRLHLVVAFVFACLLICTCTIVFTSQKAVAVSGAATIQVSQSLTSKQGQDMQQTYSYTFEAITQNAPMPEGSSSGKFTFDITGTTNVPYSFVIKNMQPSVGTPYSYKMYMNVPAVQEYYTYDTSVYFVDIYVPVDDDPIVLYFNDKEEKEKLSQPPCFNVVYDEPLPPGPGPDPEPEPQPTPGGNGN